MKRSLPLLALGLLLAFSASALAQEPKIKPTVEFASSWKEALEEARALGVPIVVHDHGFY